MRFKDKVVLITGGASGIGRAAAMTFAREGARVMIADFNGTSARDAISELQDITQDCDWVKTDVRQEDAVIRMRDKTLQAFGRIDVLVNNAGTGTTEGALEKISKEAWDADIQGHVRQMFLATKHVLPVMIQNGGGAIVNTATIEAVVGGTASLIYGPAKSGVISLTKHTAFHYGKHNIRANCVCPGHTATPSRALAYEKDATLLPKYPVGRLGRMEDIAAAYLYLSSDQSAFITGAVLMVDGGYTAGCP